jgi:hypothetical protein
MLGGSLRGHFDEVQPGKDALSETMLVALRPAFSTAMSLVFDLRQQPWLSLELLN